MPNIAVQELNDGTYWRITFENGRGNILDRQTMDGLSDVFRRGTAAPHLKAICLEGAGEHFSFGASVHEHLPEGVAAMLHSFHELAFAVLESNLLVVAAVRGSCLGGGLELASLCHRVIASPNATFGQPEIALGIFAPLASLILPERIGRVHAEDVCLTGRHVCATEAVEMGIASEVHEHPADRCQEWVETHFGHRSASSVRFAVQAIRASLLARLRQEIPLMEELYLDGLMKTADAVEGVSAFVAKRPAIWRDH